MRNGLPANTHGLHVPALYPGQLADVSFLLKTPRALLFSDAGTGKTPPLLRYAGQVLQGDGQIVWVTEKGLVQQLMAEASIWLPGVPVTMLNKADSSSRFIVATHGEITSRSSRLGWLRPELLIVDEAGVLGAGGVNPRSKTFVAHRDLASRSMRSVLATATPVATAHALDLRALMEVGHVPGTPSRVDLDRYVTYAEVLTEVPRGKWTRGLCGLSRLGDQR